MPNSARLHRDPDLHHVCFSGVLTLADTRRQFSRAPGTSGYYVGIPTLVDLRHLTGMDMRLADLMSLRDRLVEAHRSTDDPFKISLLVESETAFGIARIFETVCSQAEGIDARIAGSVSEALAHLDLADSGIAPLLQNGVARPCLNGHGIDRS